MSWYTAECLYRSELDDSVENEQLFEYRYFLVKANDDQSASEKAWKLAKSKEHSYLNANGTEVSWLLEGVEDVKEVLVEELLEQTEIYHKYFSRPLTRN